MGVLATSNRYLASARKRRDAIELTIATSSAIEGIYAPFRSKVAAAKKASLGAAKETAAGTRVKPGGKPRSA